VVEGPDLGAQHNVPGGVAVEQRPHRQHGPLGRGLGADHAQAGDAHRPGLAQPDRPPQPPGVPRRVDGVPVLEDPGDVPLGGRAVLRRAGHLDGQRVLGPVAEGARHLEAVREEVALGVTEVAAVEPHIALVEEAVEREPRPPPGRRRGCVEVAAVKQRPVGSGERRRRAPVPWHGDRIPPRIVEVGLGVRASQLVVGYRGSPPVGELADALVAWGPRRRFHGARHGTAWCQPPIRGCGTGMEVDRTRGNGFRRTEAEAMSS
jgi:hypothetical protein